MGNEDNKNEKPRKKGFFSRLGLGFKKAVESITTLAQPESEVMTDDYKQIVQDDLIKKLTGYFNGVEPEIYGLTFREIPDSRDFDVSARIKNLHGDDSNIQEASMLAEIHLPEAEFYHMPVPGAYGIDTFPPTPLPVYDYSPQIIKISLEITNSNKRAQIGINNVMEGIKGKYPNAQLVDKNTPLVLGNDDPYCERFIIDAGVNSRGKKSNVLRYLRFSINKVAVEKEIDNVLSIKDYEFQLGAPESIFTVDFPGSDDIVKSISRDKETLRNLIYANQSRGFGFSLTKFFFKIELLSSSNLIQPKDNSTDKEISFDINFTCKTGFGSSAKKSNVSTVFYYTTVSAVDRRGDDTVKLRFVKRDNYEIS